MRIGYPDAWNTKALAAFAERMKQAKNRMRWKYQKWSPSPSGKPICVMPKHCYPAMCLACHGSGIDIPDGVKVRLQSEYPFGQGHRVQVWASCVRCRLMRPL